MTEQEIREGNKLIAEFMINPPMVTIFMEYHKDWNWLMLVVGAINKIKLGDEAFDVIIYKTTVHINDSRQILIETTGKDIIKAVWQAVVEFIKWYNVQSPKS